MPTTATLAAVANVFHHHTCLGWFEVHKLLEQSCSTVTEYDYETRSNDRSAGPGKEEERIEKMRR